MNQNSIHFLLITIRLNHYVSIVGIARQYRDTIVLSIQHISVVYSFDTVQKHFLSILHSSLYHRRVDQEPFIHLPKQSTRVSAPMKVNMQLKAEPLSFWEEIPLTNQQEKVLNVIQQCGVQSSEGMSLDRLARQMNQSETELR